MNVSQDDLGLLTLPQPFSFSPCCFSNKIGGAHRALATVSNSISASQPSVVG
jgi:hypothetical protein